MYLFSLFYLSVLINPHVCFTCPPDFQMANVGVCIVVGRYISGFCAAADYCALYGQRRHQLVYLIGRNIRRIPRRMTGARSLQTGLNFLLEPPNMGTPNDVRHVNRTTQLSSQDISLWLRDGTAIRNVPRFTRRHRPRTICEYGGNLPDGHHKVRFLSNFPKPLSVLVHSEGSLSGCEHVVAARTKLDCARRCALEPACRSIYYDSGSNSCVHMMHADSLLSLSGAKRGSGWVRFAKTSVAMNMNGEK
ncbi:PAN domain protein [Opisthorchis viverrini]|uniref:PAN domain protein n=1 Tax=Opisthorchis viverrini TaxID=6198 RepID=A0A1S8WPP4_OPIVI|nr:PAN domain protein [Opisthorchis viverrini]